MAGAREAHGVISGLLAAGRRVAASLPEPERAFGPIPVRTRVGAFADVNDIRAWFEAQEVTHVVDASHAFDHRLSDAVRRAALALDLPCVRLLRQPWQVSPQDRWTPVPCLRQAVRAMGPGERAFSTTGWASICDYAGFRGDMVFMRQTHASREPPGYRFIRFVTGTPPFSQAQEETLFRSLGVSCLVCRNFGGEAGLSKLAAARRLGLRVFMVERPALPEGAEVVTSVEAALEWWARQ